MLVHSLGYDRFLRIQQAAMVEIGKGCFKIFNNCPFSDGWNLLSIVAFIFLPHPR
jgi:hypothetical protein